MVFSCGVKLFDCHPTPSPSQSIHTQFWMCKFTYLLLFTFPPSKTNKWLKSWPRYGADTIKKYWSRYYQGSQGVIFVLDSASSEEDLEVARAELHSALQHPQLCTLPFLILANHQDKPAARSVQEIKKYFELEPLARGKSWILDASSVDNMEAVKESFCQLIHLLEEKDTEAGRI
uniref:ADP-ribosylation factor-like protein 15 n=1 Tax=Paramormyrops kingsleyae TaxID=1676925 RepID=A0A3B3T575_9TELE